MLWLVLQKEHRQPMNKKLQETRIYIVYYFSGSFLMFVFKIGGAVGLLLL